MKKGKFVFDGNMVFLVLLLLFFPPFGLLYLLLRHHFEIEE